MKNTSAHKNIFHPNAPRRPCVRLPQPRQFSLLEGVLGAIGTICILICRGFDDGTPNHRATIKVDDQTQVIVKVRHSHGATGALNGLHVGRADRQRQLSRHLAQHGLLRTVGLLRPLPSKEKPFIPIENRPLLGMPEAAALCGLNVWISSLPERPQ